MAALLKVRKLTLIKIVRLMVRFSTMSTSNSKNNLGSTQQEDVIFSKCASTNHEEALAGHIYMLERKHLLIREKVPLWSYTHHFHNMSIVLICIRDCEIHIMFSML